MVRGVPLTAICVRGVDVQCVLQFTLIHADGCALHRRTSRVIHRIELCFRLSLLRERRESGNELPSLSRDRGSKPNYVRKLVREKLISTADVINTLEGMVEATPIEAYA